METSSFTEASVPHHASYLIKQLSHPPNIRSINPSDLYNYLIKQLSHPSINPNDPSKGVVVDLTINSYDPPQFPMPKSPVRDQDQNQPPKILVGKDSKKDGTVFAALTYHIEVVRCMHMYLESCT
jgi:hypothetical protein